MASTKGKRKYFEPNLQPPENPKVTFEEMDSLQEGFQNQIDTDPKYSLEIDPTGRYHFSKEDEDFISYMVQYRNVQFVSTVMMNISIERGIKMYKRYDISSELKRINLAMYARRFATKMANLDQIGGYLTSGLVDDNVPIAERWSPKEKLTATKLLIGLNTLKRESLEKPEVLNAVEIQEDLAKLNPNDIKKLIEYNDEDQVEKERLINLINEGDLLSMEEKKTLQMMDLSELTDLASTILEGEKDDENDE